MDGNEEVVFDVGNWFYNFLNGLRRNEFLFPNVSEEGVEATAAIFMSQMGSSLMKELPPFSFPFIQCVAMYYFLIPFFIIVMLARFQIQNSCNSYQAVNTAKTPWWIREIRASCGAL